MSSTNVGDAVADRQRARMARPGKRLGQSGGAEPPRQRRPALAALAVLLIVGGALAAGLVALRMDSREAVVVASTDIAPGTQITQDMLAEARVASDSLQTIDASLAPQVVGTYTTTTIPANSLVEERLLSRDAPVSGERAVVAVGLNPTLTPASSLKSGDLVQVVRVTSGSNNSSTQSKVRALTTALVLSVSRQAPDDLGGGGQGASVSLLVPDEIAGDVIDASAANAAGLALLETGQSTDVELEVAP